MATCVEWRTPFDDSSNETVVLPLSQQKYEKGIDLNAAPQEVDLPSSNLGTVAPRLFVYSFFVMKSLNDVLMTWKQSSHDALFFETLVLAHFLRIQSSYVMRKGSTWMRPPPRKSWSPYPFLARALVPLLLSQPSLDDISLLRLHCSHGRQTD